MESRARELAEEIERAEPLSPGTPAPLFTQPRGRSVLGNSVL